MQGIRILLVSALCALLPMLLASQTMPNGKKLKPRLVPPSESPTAPVKALSPQLMPGSGLPVNHEDVLFEYLPASLTGVDFENKILENPYRNTGHYDYMFNGSGVAIADFDNDGLPDLFFCGNDAPNKIYRNKGNMVFENMSAKAGVESGKWATGVTVADINNDGRLDIYVCHSGPKSGKPHSVNALYVNQGDFTFTEEAEKYGIADESLSTQAVFFDMDLDGDLDLFVLNHAIRNWANQPYEWYEEVKKIPAADLPRFCNTLYRNNGNGTFSDVSKEAGIDEIGFGLGVSVFDFNQDGLSDIFVANDYFVPDRLFLNLGSGRFREALGEKFSHTSFNSMGCDAADLNNDGLTDLMVLDMSPNDHFRSKTMMSSMDVPQFRYLTEGKGFMPQYMFNCLYMNSGGGIMSNVSHLAGVANTDWSWAPLLVDFDNDGWKDIYVTNGFVRDLNDNDWRMGLADYLKDGQLAWEDYFKHYLEAKSQPIANAMYENTGAPAFRDAAKQWGMDRLSFSHGSAAGDLDGDGDMDLVVNNIGQPAFVIKNLASDKAGMHFIRFRLADLTGGHTDDGAEVTIYGQGAMQRVLNRHTRGFQSFSEPVVHFGLGKQAAIDSAVIRWASGLVTVLQNPETDKTHSVGFGKVQVFNRKEKLPDRMFWDISDMALRPPAVHFENQFDDFAKEVLLPHRMSQLGPCLAVADANGDGLDDFYLGGAAGTAGMLFVQNQNGYFNYMQQPVFAKHTTSEQLGALFFDANGDGHPDLYVANGGGGDVTDPENLRDWFYLNDGKGLFSMGQSFETGSTKAISAFDWDGDGDLDLFVGGRNVPGKYPLAPDSYLWVNEKGTFVDRTMELCSELRTAGMVTSALFTDFDNDKFPELMVVGEWMKPLFFSYSKKLRKFIPANQQISRNNQPWSGSGWWFSAVESDLNKDGLPDYLLGNLGLNNKFHPSPEKPLFVFANDMDDNGTLDIVLSKNYQDRLVPVRGKECSTAQMPFLSEKVPSYSQFASSSLIEIYGSKKIDESTELKSETMESVVLMNKGAGKFEVVPLPISAQVSPIQGFVTGDFNKDNNTDIVLGGNFFPTEPETMPYDAGKGLLLLSEEGTWKPIPVLQSGIFLPGDIRTVLPIFISKDRIPGIISVGNNGKVRIQIVASD